MVINGKVEIVADIYSDNFAAKDYCKILSFPYCWGYSFGAISFLELGQKLTFLFFAEKLNVIQYLNSVFPLLYLSIII